MITNTREIHIFCQYETKYYSYRQLKYETCIEEIKMQKMAKRFVI